MNLRQPAVSAMASSHAAETGILLAGQSQTASRGTSSRSMGQVSATGRLTSSALQGAQSGASPSSSSETAIPAKLPNSAPQTTESLLGSTPATAGLIAQTAPAYALPNKGAQTRAAATQSGFAAAAASGTVTFRLPTVVQCQAQCK